MATLIAKPKLDIQVQLLLNLAETSALEAADKALNQ